MVHSPKVVVKRTVSIDMMLEDESLPFLLVVAGRTAGNNQPRMDISENSLPLSECQEAPSGLRPPVNP